MNLSRFDVWGRNLNLFLSGWSLVFWYNMRREIFWHQRPYGGIISPSLCKTSKQFSSSPIALYLLLWDLVSLISTIFLRVSDGVDKCFSSCAGHLFSDSGFSYFWPLINQPLRQNIRNHQTQPKTPENIRKFKTSENNGKQQNKLSESLSKQLVFSKQSSVLVHKNFFFIFLF